MKTLQDLAKRWWLVSKEGGSGALAKPKWEGVVVSEAVWRERTQTVEEEEMLYLWGMIIGQFGSEENALKALGREEIEDRLLTDRNGITKTPDVRGVDSGTFLL